MAMAVNKMAKMMSQLRVGTGYVPVVSDVFLAPASVNL